MRMPIGIDNFSELITENYDFIDKSLLIQDVIKNPAKISLITRPRRFGKTLNMSMLHHFFASIVVSQKTDHLFEGLEISKTLEYKHKGKFPVIFITLKEIKSKKYSEAYADLVLLVSELFQEFDYLLGSKSIEEATKEKFTRIIEQRGNSAEVKKSILLLSRMLYNHHDKQKVWLLIDEYDTPIQAAYQHGYYDDMILTMRNFLGAALKGNSHLHKAVLTGIMQISKESLFSDLNHFESYSLIRNEFGQYFGFTEKEIKYLLKRSKLEDKEQEIRSWYNGYQVGSHLLYNPWSIINCLNRQGECIPYWVNTSQNSLIAEMTLKSPGNIQSSFESLLKGEEIKKDLYDNMSFTYLDSIPGELAFWTLFLASGYITVKESKPTLLRYACSIKIPNREVLILYQEIFLNWLSRNSTLDWHAELMQAIFEGDTGIINNKLQVMLEQIISYHDLAKDKGEAFFHGFLLGIISQLLDSHIVRSNKESGLGRYDILAYPKNRQGRGAIIEIKACETEAVLESVANKAVEQVYNKRYVAELDENDIAEYVCIGIAFSGKHAKSRASFSEHLRE